ncbi:hypothetical protein Q1695_000796 [Nippostrongylus brasiliensis]|nr:hypothetical protein Q1695_000796 [Nippostrongylus brasiliensis]
MLETCHTVAPAPYSTGLSRVLYDQQSVQKSHISGNKMVARVMILVAVLFTILATSTAQQERTVGAIPSRYSFYQDRVYGYTPPLTLLRMYGAKPVSKRNNAEVVNHILKNFGTLDRLGDVGK